MLSERDLERGLPRWFKSLLDWDAAVQGNESALERQRLWEACEQQASRLTDEDIARLPADRQEEFHALRRYCDALQRGAPKDEREELLEKYRSTR